MDSNSTRFNLRLRIIKNFGGRCFGCGETDPAVLQFHHKKHNGNLDRAARGHNRIYQDLANGRGLNDFLLLCANCHYKEHHSIIPPTWYYVPKEAFPDPPPIIKAPKMKAKKPPRLRKDGSPRRSFYELTQEALSKPLPPHTPLYPDAVVIIHKPK